MADVSAASSPSPFVAGVAPITETDAQVAAALQHAELAPLLPALAYLTGDMSLLRDDLRPDPLMLNLPFSGFTEEQQAEIRSLAVAALSRYRDGGCVPAAAPGDAQLLQMLEFTVGGAGMADYLPLLEELAYKGEDRRAPQWRRLARSDDDAQRGHHRCRHVGHPRRASVAASGRAVHHPRQERRCGRHLV